jgi:tetratricopeptide (TPR) repeat protein
MAMSKARLSGFAFAMLIGAATCMAAGGGPMPSGGAAARFEQREASPEEQAKDAYNAGLRLIKKAKDYDGDAEKASSADKKTKAREKAGAAYGKALEKFSAAIENQPDMVEAWNYVGFANRHLGAYAESLDAYNRALTLNPKYFLAVEYRAEAFLGLNRIDDAKSAYMDLYRDARPLSDELLAAMQKWVSDRRQDAKGLTATDIDAFEKWVNERGVIAKQTASLAVGDAVKPWH